MINGYEVGSGAIRNNDYNSLLKQLGDNSEFNSFLEAFKYGVPNHGGAAIGIERLMMALDNTIDNISDLYAFPLTPSGEDKLFNSPSNIDN